MSKDTPDYPDGPGYSAKKWRKKKKEKNVDVRLVAVSKDLPKISALGANQEGRVGKPGCGSPTFGCCQSIREFLREIAPHHRPGQDFMSRVRFSVRVWLCSLKARDDPSSVPSLLVLCSKTVDILFVTIDEILFCILGEKNNFFQIFFQQSF